MDNKLRMFFEDVFSINDARATKEEIKTRIIQNSKLKGPNMCGLVFAIILASIGLNIDSLTVAIGAMLISPLMGGIQGIGYALATTDLKYFKRVFVGFLIEISLCIITSTLYFFLSPINADSSSLLQVYSPKIWDAIIAFVAGLAGIIAITRKESTGSVLPGVAVACSIILPLCRVGYAVTKFDFYYVLKALYLFFINAFFICLATIIVLRILKIQRKREVDRAERRRIFVELTVIGIIIIIPCSFFAYDAVNQALLENNAKKYISSEFNFEKTQVVKSTIDVDKRQINIALIGEVLDADTIKKITERQKNYKIDNMNLKITQTSIYDGVTSEELENLKTELLALKTLVNDKNMLIYDKDKITEELKKNYTKISNCSISSTQVLNSQTGEYESSIIVTLTITDRLTSKELSEVRTYLVNELKNSDFEIQYTFK